ALAPGGGFRRAVRSRADSPSLFRARETHPFVFVVTAPAAAAAFTLSLHDALPILRLSPAPPAENADKPSLRGIAEGARYAWSRPVLLGTYAVDLAAMFFAFPNAIFPFLADELDADWSLGLMYAAGSVGSVLVS